MSAVLLKAVRDLRQHGLHKIADEVENVCVPLVEACRFAMEPDAVFSMSKEVYLKRIIVEIQDRCGAALANAEGGDS